MAASFRADRRRRRSPRTVRRSRARGPARPHPTWESSKGARPQAGLTVTGSHRPKRLQVLRGGVLPRNAYVPAAAYVPAKAIGATGRIGFRDGMEKAFIGIS